MAPKKQGADNGNVPMRKGLIRAVLLTPLGGVLFAQSTAHAEPAVPFDVWLAELINEANERGYNEALVNDTLAGIEPLPRVIQADRSQAERTPGLDRYLSTRITRTVVNRGRAQAKENRTLLSRIEAEYGVQRRFVLSIWGMESRFGRVTGREPIFRALATLAWEPRRSEEHTS